MEKKKLILKIMIPFIMVAVVVGIWLIKNPNVSDEKSDSVEIQTEAELPDKLKDADFSLNETTMVDFEKLSEYGLPIIVDYGSDSCISCKAMAPVLETMNKEMRGKAFIKFVDVWKYGDATQNVPVQVIPTQVLFNADGIPFVPSEELSKQIQFDMYSSRDTNEHVFTVHKGGLTEDEMRAILKEMGVE